MLCHQIAAGVVPGAAADAVARIHGGSGWGCLGAEIGAPGVIAGTLLLRQSLAVGVSSGKPAEIPAFANPLAGNEEAGHRLVAAHRDRRWRVSSCRRISALRFGLLIESG